MISDVRLHGNIGPVEYFAFLGGERAYKTYFYEESPARRQVLLQGERIHDHVRRRPLQRDRRKFL